MSPYPLSKSLAKGTPNSQAASMMAAILAEQNQVEQGSTMSAQCWHLPGKPSRKNLVFFV